MAEALDGADLLLLLDQLFRNPPESSREITCHQDREYWAVRPLAACTAWLALDDVDEGNGALRVIPGSHRGALLTHDAKDDDDLVLKYALSEKQFVISAARTTELKAGQISRHDIGGVRGSPANNSTRRRPGYAIRYMPATSLVDRTIQPSDPHGTTCLASS